MKKSVLIVLINKRKDAAVKVQKILTEWGCLIKTRLGLHDGGVEDCSENGLVILELVGTEEKKEQLNKLLDNLPDVSTKLVELSV